MISRIILLIVFLWLDVHEKTVHLVQKPPPAAGSPSNQGQSQSTPGAGPNQDAPRFMPGRTVHIPGGPAGPNSVLVGAFTFDANRLRGIVESVVSQVGNVVGAQNAQVTYVTSRSSQDGSSLDVHINIDQLPGGQQQPNNVAGSNESNPPPAPPSAEQNPETTQEQSSQNITPGSMNAEQTPQPNADRPEPGRPSNNSSGVPPSQGPQGDARGHTAELNQLGQQLSQLVGGLLNSLLQHPVVNGPVAVPLPALYQNLAQALNEITQREIRIVVSNVASNPPSVYQYVLRDRNMISMMDRDIQTPNDWSSIEAETSASATSVHSGRVFRLHSNDDNQSASMSVGSDETDDANDESMEVVDAAEIESLPDMDHAPAQPSAPPLSQAETQTASVFKRPLTVPSHREFGPQITIGSKPWHSTVPHTWIPIMEEDTEKQRREKPQRPFSDAYLHGVPKKRRRANATSASVQPLPNLISSMLEQAIDSTGARPTSGSSAHQIAQEAARDERLVNSFERNLRRSLSNRITTDTDFDPSRFPKTKDYLSL